MISLKNNGNEKMTDKEVKIKTTAQVAIPLAAKKKLDIGSRDKDMTIQEGLTHCIEKVFGKVKVTGNNDE